MEPSLPIVIVASGVAYMVLAVANVAVSGLEASRDKMVRRERQRVYGVAFMALLALFLYWASVGPWGYDMNPARFATALCVFALLVPAAHIVAVGVRKARREFANSKDPHYKPRMRKGHQEFVQTKEAQVPYVVVADREPFPEPFVVKD